MNSRPPSSRGEVTPSARGYFCDEVWHLWNLAVAELFRKTWFDLARQQGICRAEIGGFQPFCHPCMSPFCRILPVWFEELASL